MALEYNREYRTYFHVAQNYGVTEIYACKIICWVEGTLIKDKRFVLPGRKELFKTDIEYEVVLVDASETGDDSMRLGRSLLAVPSICNYAMQLSREPACRQ